MSVFQKRIAFNVMKSRLFIWTTVLPFVVAIAVITYFLSIKDLIVFPNANHFDYNFYTDNAAGGTSEIIEGVASDSIIQIEFKLKKDIASPYVGITISPKPRSILRLDDYNKLIIKTKGSNFNNLNIALFAQNPYPEKRKRSPEISFFTTVNISSSIKTYLLDFDRFKVPDWWYEINNISEAMSRNPVIRDITNLNIANAYTPNAGEKQSFQIYSIVFSRNNKPLAMLLLSIELGIILTAFVIFYSVEMIRSGKKSIIITYKAVEGEQATASRSDFIDFINQNFQNSQLTLEFVSGETGISQRKITADIQNRFNCNFKSYINRLRITESKRLLLESDLNIGEIAYKVGFNNQSHFNRVFKSELLVSPTEYRDKIKTS